MPELTLQRRPTTHFDDVLAQGRNKDADESIPHAARDTSESIEALIAGDLNACEKLVELASTSENARQVLFQLKGEKAEHVMNSIQKWLDENQADSRPRRRAIHVLVRLASTSGTLPPNLFLSGIQITPDDPNRTGGLADVFKGYLEGKSVAIKILRDSTLGATTGKQHTMLCREALIWRQLRHDHVLPFLGIYNGKNAQLRNGMVSLWMEYSSLRSFLRHSDFSAERDRSRIFTEVCEGLAYLHSQMIAHGDLKTANILINHNRRAFLADFGVSSLTEALTGRTITTTGGVAATLAWLSPERLKADVGDPNRPTLACDVYAMGLLSVVIYTAEEPFARWPVGSIVRRVLEGERLSQPSDMDDLFWSQVTQRCWEANPKMRPSMKEVLYSLQSLQEGHQHVDQTTVEISQPSALGSKKDRRQQKKGQKKQLERLADNTGATIRFKDALNAESASSSERVQDPATAAAKQSKATAQGVVAKPLKRETKPTRSLTHTDGKSTKGYNLTTLDDTVPSISTTDHITDFVSSRPRPTVVETLVEKKLQAPVQALAHEDSSTTFNKSSTPEVGSSSVTGKDEACTPAQSHDMAHEATIANTGSVLKEIRTGKAEAKAKASKIDVEATEATVRTLSATREEPRDATQRTDDTKEHTSTNGECPEAETTLPAPSNTDKRADSPNPSQTPPSIVPTLRNEDSGSASHYLLQPEMSVSKDHTDQSHESGGTRTDKHPNQSGTKSEQATVNEEKAQQTNQSARPSGNVDTIRTEQEEQKVSCRCCCIVQ